MHLCVAPGALWPCAQPPNALKASIRPSRLNGLELRSKLQTHAMELAIVALNINRVLASACGTIQIEAAPTIHWRDGTAVAAGMDGWDEQLRASQVELARANLKPAVALDDAFYHQPLLAQHHRRKQENATQLRRHVEVHQLVPIVRGQRRSHHHRLRRKRRHDLAHDNVVSHECVHRTSSGRTIRREHARNRWQPPLEHRVRRRQPWEMAPVQGHGLRQDGCTTGSVIVVGVIFGRVERNGTCRTSATGSWWRAFAAFNGPRLETE